MTIFFRVLEAPINEKAFTLLSAVAQLRGREQHLCTSYQVFERNSDSFAAIPRTSLAYWATTELLEVFAKNPAFETEERIARISNPVGDNLRFVRTWWEIAPDAMALQGGATSGWVLLCKGGAFAPYYYDPHLLVKWNFVRRTYHGFIGTEHRPLEKPACVEYFFKPGMTWPVRTSGLSFRIMPTGCVFSSKGPAAFDLSYDYSKLLAITSILNSRPFFSLVSLQLARTELAQSYEVGLIQQTPFPSLSEPDIVALSKCARRAWSLRRLLDATNENSHAFVLPSALIKGVMGVDPAAIEVELKAI